MSRMVLDLMTMVLAVAFLAGTGLLAWIGGISLYAWSQRRR